MGTEIAADIIAENHSNSEQRLWRNVILNAFEDTRIENTDRKSSLIKLDAHDWICESEDFEQICWWAGWDPEEVKIRYKKAVQGNDIKFFKKHVKWREYNKTWNKLKVETDKEKRKELRKKIESLRSNIMGCTHILMTTLFKEVKV